MGFSDCTEPSEDDRVRAATERERLSFALKVIVFVGSRMSRLANRQASAW